MAEDAGQKSTMNLRTGRQFLLNLGWQISQTQIYKHRELGKLRTQPNGEYTAADLLRYARKYLKRTDGAPVSREDDNLIQEKTLADIRKAKAQAVAWEAKARELSEKYVTRKWHERELVARALLFKSDITNFIHGHAGEIISLVRGDAAMILDLIEFMQDKAEDWLSTYSTDRAYEVVMPIAEADTVEPDDFSDEDEAGDLDGDE